MGAAACLSVAVAVLLAPTVIEVPGVRDRLIAQGLLRGPQPFVELSFGNPRELRKFVDWTGKVKVNFVLSSHLPADTVVAWSFEAAHEGGAVTQLRSGRSGLLTGRSRTLRVAGKVSCADGRVAVTVRIRPADGVSFAPDEIHFWVVRNAEAVAGGIKQTSCKAA